MDEGRAVLNYKFVCNKPQSEFLNDEVEYCRSRELLEHSMMKSSTPYLNVDPSPLYVRHVTGVPRPSPLFAVLPLLCIMLNANQRTKNWEQCYDT